MTAAIRLAIAGLTIFPPGVLPENQLAGGRLIGFDELSPTDRAVLGQLARGFSNQQIAALLGRPIERVRKSVNQIFRTLGCVNRTEVAVLVHGRLSAFVDPLCLTSAPVGEI